MSEADDPESKTQEATEKKIQDALEEGRAPVSRDLTNAFGLLSLLLCLAFIVEGGTRRLTESLTRVFSNAGTLYVGSGADMGRYIETLALEVGIFLAPVVFAFMVAGLAGAFVQSAPRFVVFRIVPDVSRLSVIAGWRRIFGVDGAIELGKVFIKLLIVGGAIVFSGLADQAAMTDAMRSDPALLPGIALRILMHLTGVVSIAFGLVAAGDFIWSRIKWRRDLRMSREEIKEEFRQAEGDPFVKSRMRSIAMDRARRRMMAAVPTASLVIANPTHYAIALRYVREEGGAPRVVAKGKDLIALKIREIARRNQVPVFERKELARGMFDFVEVDQMIPPEFYRPVAELIHFIHTIAQRR